MVSDKAVAVIIYAFGDFGFEKGQVAKSSPEVSPKEFGNSINVVDSVKTTFNFVKSKLNFKSKIMSWL